MLPPCKQAGALCERSELNASEHFIVRVCTLRSAHQKMASAEETSDVGWGEASAGTLRQVERSETCCPRARGERGEERGERGQGRGERREDARREGRGQRGEERGERREGRGERGEERGERREWRGERGDER